MKEQWRELKGANIPSFMACIDNCQPRWVKDEKGHTIPNKKRKTMIIDRKDLKKYGIYDER